MQRRSSDKIPQWATLMAFWNFSWMPVDKGNCQSGFGLMFWKLDGELLPGVNIINFSRWENLFRDLHSKLFIVLFYEVPSFNCTQEIL